jgi:endonuclease YncB( thermonuclease family)|tara:strand:- start:161 stop:661 length:501 start_codon:yes stop_codon:yes gene_type:complete
MFLNKRKAILVISISSLIFFTTLNQVKSQELRVVDGDTIHLNGEKIRFSGIDTPESFYRGKRQKCIFQKVEVYCGYWSKIVLIEKISDNEVTCVKESEPDRYNRILAECFVKGESLSKYLVRSGYAFAFRRYSKKFIEDEEFAKANKLGLWQTEFQFPWKFRKNPK